jgi:hypothetical protein
MSEGSFHPGEQVWLRGQLVTFVDHHTYAPNQSIDAAVIRRQGETSVRVVPLWKLTRDRAASLTRTSAKPAS